MNETIEAGTGTIDALNTFLRGELAAVETYELALERVADEGVRPTLVESLRLHAHRAALLVARIADLGGMPARSSGMWGTLARLVEGGARVLGAAVALDALVEGEELGLASYRRHLEELDAVSRQFVEIQLLGGQEYTRRLVTEARRQLNH